MSNLLMFDSISPGALPAGYSAYAGYVDGAWPDYEAEVARFPNAAIYSVDVNASSSWADYLDVEKGDATNANAPGSYNLRRARLQRPGFYTSVANAMAMLGVLANAGIVRARVRLWTAHYTGVAHLCGPQCGFGMNTVADGTQWSDTAFNGSCDESLITPSFADSPVPVPGPPPPPPTHYPGDNVQVFNVNVAVAGGSGWVPSPVPVSKLVSGWFAVENPDVVGHYDTVPTVVQASATPGPHSPNGTVVVRGFVPDGTYTLVLWFAE